MRKRTKRTRSTEETEGSVISNVFCLLIYHLIDFLIGQLLTEVGHDL